MVYIRAIGEGYTTEALKEISVMYVSFKYGDFEVIRDERYYTDMNETLFENIISKTKFKVEDIVITGDKLERKEKWFNTYLKKIIIYFY